MGIYHDQARRDGPRAGSIARIPSLDGLRAIAISMVLLAHLQGTRDFPDIGALHRFIEPGYAGVTVFFVISGFLITRLLLEEHARSGRIDLRRFYMRRTFRIFPAYYAYIAVIAVAATLGWVVLLPGDLTAAVTYTMNYHTYPGRSWYLGHSWSLAVEEQFYLLWPLAFGLLGPARGLLAAGGFVLAAPFIRLACLMAVPYGYPLFAIFNTFETTGDAVAVGCVLACLRDRLWEQPVYRRWLGSGWFLLCPLVALAAFSTHPHTRVYFFAHTVALVCVALLVDRCVRYHSDFIGRLLNARPVVGFGMLSYSIYLWQQPFLNRERPSTWTTFPLNLALAFACALGSYYLVEQPGLRLRQRVEAWLRDRARRPRAVPAAPERIPHQPPAGARDAGVPPLGVVPAAEAQ